MNLTLCRTPARPTLHSRPRRALGALSTTLGASTRGRVRAYMACVCLAAEVRGDVRHPEMGERATVPQRSDGMGKRVSGLKRARLLPVLIIARDEGPSLF